MANQIILTNDSLSTSSVRLVNGSFSYGWKNLTTADPSNSQFGNVEAQSVGWENPIINLNFYIPIDNIPSGTMTWALWNEYVKNQEVGTSATQTKLGVVVGKNDTSFVSYASSLTGSTTNIPVVIKNYTLTFSPSDSRNAAFWNIKATLLETSEV